MFLKCMECKRKNFNQMIEINFLKEFRIATTLLQNFKDLNFSSQTSIFEKLSGSHVFKNPFCNPFPS